MTPIHLLFLFSAIPAIGYADIQGTAWILGKKQTLNERTLHRLHVWIYVCLAGIILTGILMFLGNSSELLAKPAFYMKMVFVAALILNSFFIEKHMEHAVTKSFSTLTTNERRWVLTSGVVSSVAWVGAIVGGLLIG